MLVVPIGGANISSAMRLDLRSPIRHAGVSAPGSTGGALVDEAVIIAQASKLCP